MILEYEQKLEKIDIKLLEKYTYAKTKHKMQCLICSHIWNATPVSKIRSNKMYGGNGCPNCDEIKHQQRLENTRYQNLINLQNRGLEVLTPGYDGRRTMPLKQSTPLKLQVLNKNCGHIFETDSKNLLGRNVSCPICAMEFRIQILNNSSRERSKEWSQTAPAWKVYRQKVMNLTRINYNLHKNKINPNNLPFGLAGTPGAYHLDHIRSIRLCFESNIPPEQCADIKNLQVLPWLENVLKR